MNGYTPSTPIKTRVMNLVEQIPNEYRNRAVAECVDTNPHDFERALTGYVMGRVWETYEHPVNEAADVAYEDDPRTEWERDWDDYCADVTATRESDRPF